MSRIATILLVSALASPAAHAQIAIVPPVNLYTPALTVVYSQNDGSIIPNLVCTAVNVSGGDRSVRIRIRAEDGTVLHDSSNFTIAPTRAAYQLAAATLGKIEYGGDGTGYFVLRNAYCQFTFVGTKADLRASGSIRRSPFVSPNIPLSDEVVVPAE